MSAITQVVQLHAKESGDLDQVAREIAQKESQEPDVLCVRYSPRHEDASRGCLFIDRQGSAEGEQFLHRSLAAETDSLVNVGSVKPYHLSFQPNPPSVLDNTLGDGKRGRTKVAEVVHLYFAAELSADQSQEVLATVQQFVDAIMSKPPEGSSGEKALGWVAEELDFKDDRCRALVLVLGWDSVEAHMAFRETEDFAKHIPLLRDLPALKGMEMWHVSNRDMTV